MLPRILAILLLLASFILAGKLVIDATVFDFWTAQWFIGVLGTLAMIGAGVALLFFSQEDEVYLALAIFGCVYVLATAIVYVAWSIQHISESLTFARYIGFLLLCLLSGAVASVSLRVYSDNEGFGEIYLFPAWLIGFANVFCILYVAYKYVFEQSAWFFWPFLGELLIIVLGAFTFISCYTIGQTARLKHAEASFSPE